MRRFVAATLVAGVSRSVYLDGDPVVTTVPGGHSVSGNPFRIGESSVFRGRYFPGRLDKIAVYDRALSDAEVRALYSGGPACYANCDNSTAAPILNVNDFICFQPHFASGDGYANCDGSTKVLVLNVNDFI